MTNKLTSNAFDYLLELEKRNEILSYYATSSSTYLDNLQPKYQDDLNTYDEINFLKNVQQVIINEIASLQLDITDKYSYSNNTPNSLHLNSDNKSLLMFKDNIKRLIKISKLETNWDGYGAEIFDKNLIDYCIEIISSTELLYQPTIYPTLDGLVHFQFDISATKHLEIQISLESSFYYERIDSSNNKGTLNNKSEIIKLINGFFSK